MYRSIHESSRDLRNTILAASCSVSCSEVAVSVAAKLQCQLQRSCSFVCRYEFIDRIYIYASSHGLFNIFVAASVAAQLQCQLQRKGKIRVLLIDSYW